MRQKWSGRRSVADKHAPSAERLVVAMPEDEEEDQGEDDEDDDDDDDDEDEEDNDEDDN
jgi:hypothetical protein